MKKKVFYLLSFLLLLGSSSFAQVNSAKVYWVGHSLMSGVDPYASGTTSVIELVSTLATAAGKNYSHYKHTTPGAPIGWNWGGPEDAWTGGVNDLIQPLLNTSHADYGTYDVMVVTEGVNLHSSFYWWASEFYARYFFEAARAANPNVRMFIYESWHHYNAGDDDFRDLYGPMESFDWRRYMVDVRAFWNAIADRAGNLNTPFDPSITPSYINLNFTAERTAPTEPYRGPGTDPTHTDDVFDVYIVPTGQVLVATIDRLNENRASDDWTYSDAAVGGQLSAIDFFVNPLLSPSLDPNDPASTFHDGAFDDIHPSHILIYLNALTHYAVIYRENPNNLPAANNVPENVANIFKEVVWEVVNNDPRTGLGATTSLGKIENETTEKFALHPNPAKETLNIEYPGEVKEYKIINMTGATLKVGAEKRIDISDLKEGVYWIKIGESQKKFVKQ